MSEIKSVNIRIQMRKYDRMTDMATFNYINKDGDIMKASVSRFVFERLMVDNAWDPVKLGSMESYQVEIRDIVKDEVKGNYLEWFDTEANRCCMEMYA